LIHREAAECEQCAKLLRKEDKSISGAAEAPAAGREAPRMRSGSDADRREGRKGAGGRDDGAPIEEERIRAMREGSLPLERIAMLIRGLRHAGLCVLYQDRDLAVLLVENPFDSWPDSAAILAAGDRAIFHGTTADAVISAKRRVIETGQPERVEAHLTKGEYDCWYELSIEPDTDRRGHVRGIFVAAADITEHKRREETLRGLLAEVSHRSRNLLAIVQSILGQTMRLETDPVDFASKLRGRIQALAITQDIVTQANWKGAGFRHLASAQLDPFTEPSQFWLEIVGDDPQLLPNVALHVGLALHELAANSAAYGVLRNRSGALRVGIEAAAGRLRFEWDERHAEPVEPGHARFGSAVLTQVLPSATGGTATFEMNPDGVRYVLEMPRT
jgi:two-component sensor histidine kinase